MKLFDVYPLFDIEPVKGVGAYVWDARGQRYLDLYGGHAVISIGHSHPHYVRRLTTQLEQLGFYSNSVQNRLQEELAALLGRQSGYDSYALFLINSGAEAIENALKLASFYNQRKKVIVVDKAFHGRTAGAVAITDNPRIQAAINPAYHVYKLPLNDLSALEAEMKTGDVCALVLEGIQGVGGIYTPEPAYWQAARELCDKYDTVLIADEIQSGYGRSGRFFAHQYAEVRPDLITVAKGMGNGFPMGGVLIHPRFEPWPGMLGTTFGGNHLACAAGLAVLEVLEEERLIEHAAQMGAFLMDALQDHPGVAEVRGQGLMIGLQLKGPAKPVREALLFEHHIFTGSASQAETLRLLPPLNIGREVLETFLSAFSQVMEGQKI